MVVEVAEFEFVEDFVFSFEKRYGRQPLGPGSKVHPVFLPSLFSLPLKALLSVRAPSRNVHNKAKHRQTGRFCQIFSAFPFLATLNLQFKIIDPS